MSEAEEKVSVILPVYNAEGTLERAVNSALGQTWRNVEVIVVDDGSTDHSGAIADDFAREHANVQVIHIPDLGVSAARNAGLGAATGDFITFLDADDALDRDMIRRLMQLHTAAGAQICGCGFRTTAPGSAAPENEKGSREILGTSETAPGESAEVFQGSEIVRRCILTDHDTRVWSKLYTRSVIGTHRFEEGLTIGEDMLFFLSLLRDDTRYALLADSLYLYTINPLGAMERPFAPAYMDQLRCWEEARTLLEQQFPMVLQDNPSAARLSGIQVVSAVLTASKISRLPENRAREYRPYFETCRATVRQYLTGPGVSSCLPRNYRGKAWLLIHLPRLFRKATQLAGRRRSER